MRVKGARASEERATLVEDGRSREVMGQGIFGDGLASKLEGDGDPREWEPESCGGAEGSPRMVAPMEADSRLIHEDSGARRRGWIPG